MDRLVQFFRALSEETRLRMVMLLTQGELCVCDLMLVLDEPQSKVSRHLAYLKHSGLTKSKRVGVWMHYWLAETSSGMSKSHLSLLKEQLSHIPPFSTDIKKLRELKRQGSCKAALKVKTARWSKAHFVGPKRASL